MRSDGAVRFDEVKPQLCRRALEPLYLLLAVAFLVVLQTLVDVLVSPLEQAIHQAGEFVRHGGDRFRRTEAGAEATVLGTEVALTAQ